MIILTLFKLILGKFSCELGPIMIYDFFISQMSAFEQFLYGLWPKITSGQFSCKMNQIVIPSNKYYFLY